MDNMRISGNEPSSVILRQTKWLQQIENIDPKVPKQGEAIRKPPKFGNKVKIGNKVQLGNKFENMCNVLSIEGVFVYGHVPECHVTFERGRLHNV